MTGSGALHRAGVPGAHDFLFRVPWPWTDATYEAVTLTEWGWGGEAGVTADLCTLAKNTFKCSTKSAPHFSDENIGVPVPALLVSAAGLLPLWSPFNCFSPHTPVLLSFLLRC